jgi:rubrerythrin
MVKILLAEIEKVRRASKAADLYEPLQSAIELEHSTIPPYLTAFYSIKRGFNKEVADIILSVVRQEMLHMTIAANVLNAIGGHPVVNEPNFIPKYPGRLPGNIEPNLQVGLMPLSKALVKNVFMEIEKPEEPQNFPQEYIPPVVTKKALLDIPFGIQPEYKTIGEFYQAIIDKIKDLDCIAITPRFQVVNEQWFTGNLLFSITDKNKAEEALTLIAEQGEGVGKSPLDGQREFAHYYKFSQIFEGYHLYQKSQSEFVYNTAQPISFDAAGIYDLVGNFKVTYYQPNSVARRMVNKFNYSYTSLLNGLHKTFNGEPSYLNTVMGLMFDLKLQAEKMAEKKILLEELNLAKLREVLSPKDIEEITEKINKQELCVAPSFEYALTD